ncbi:ABC-2 type transport system ATP-binding protein [Methanophagales archaeon]|nr:ABC-2 type transport system ATP-binding protein [Methanophagales archaeon]
MIEVQNLTKTFNGKTVLNGISFEVKEGEIFGYLGPNGAGKTTTMRISLGLLKPTSGNVLVQGQNLGENEEIRNTVGVLLENDGLYKGLSAHENQDYYAQLYGISDGVARKRRIGELLDFVGLSDRRAENTKVTVTLMGKDTSTLLSTLTGEGIKVEEITKTSKSLEEDLQFRG